MTLRDAIREMVRWCQMTTKELASTKWLARPCPEACANRDAFRKLIEIKAIEVVRSAIDDESLPSRLVLVAHIVFLESSPTKSDWRTATRSVWATL